MTVELKSESVLGGNSHQRSTLQLVFSSGVWIYRYIYICKTAALDTGKEQQQCAQKKKERKGKNENFVFRH